MGQPHGGFRAPAPEGREELLEVELLPGVGDVDDFVGLPGLEPVGQGGEVGGGVVVAAVALLDQGRMRLQGGQVVEEDHPGALAFGAR